MPRIRVISKNDDGHRREYNALFRSEILRQGSIPDFERGSFLPNFVGKDPIFFLMLDENLGLFAACALTAWLRRRSVSGLFFRPGECFRSGFKYTLKRQIFKILKSLPRVNIITILPFQADRRFETVANSWIWDPQMWDTLQLDYLNDGSSEASEDEDLVRLVKETACGRKIVVSLGAQSISKGLDKFCGAWDEPAVRDRFLFVTAGKVSRDCSARIEDFAEKGGLVANRFISERELSQLYRCADIVWAAYGESYNQASGISGRAFQLGKPVIVRPGSYMETALAQAGATIVPMPRAPLSNWLDAVEGVSVEHPPSRQALEALRATFVDALSINKS